MEVKVDAGDGTILAQESGQEDQEDESDVEEANDGPDGDAIQWEEEGENETEN